MKKLDVIAMYILIISLHIFCDNILGYEWEDQTIEDHHEDPEINLR